jgi:hypothetical protein
MAKLSLLNFFKENEDFLLCRSAYQKKEGRDSSNKENNLLTIKCFKLFFWFN